MLHLTPSAYATPHTTDHFIPSFSSTFSSSSSSSSPTQLTKMATLHQAFLAFCPRGSDTMDGPKYVKLCRDCKFIGPGFQTADADICFAKAAKAVGTKKIPFEAFKTHLLAPLIGKKREEDEVIAAIIENCPASSPPSTPQYADQRAAVHGDAPVVPISERTAENERQAPLLRKGYSGGGAGSTLKRGGPPSAAKLSPKGSAKSWERTPTPTKDGIKKEKSWERTTTPKKDGKDKKAPFRPSSATVTPVEVELIPKKKPAAKAGGAAFKFVDEADADAPIAEIATKEGFTVVQGMDVTKGRILTDEMREELVEENNADLTTV